MNSKNLYWSRLWAQKAEQLKEKADLLFPKDEVVKKTYEEILRDKKRIQVKIVKRAVLGSFLLVLIFLGVIGEIYNINRTIEEGKKLVIPDTELGRLLPNLEGVNGKVSFATSEILSIECFNIDLSAHENFRNQCIERGFVIDSKTDGVVYEAYNSEGYRLRISYYDNNMRIRINARIQMRKIQWPNTGISKLLPIPKSDLGKISYSSDKYLTIYIGNTSLEEFTAYINECVKRGFTEEMRQYHNDYFAKNKDGVSLSLRYEGYQIMYIDLHEENR